MSTDSEPSTGKRLPTYCISHGGGPWPWIKDLMPFDVEPLESSLAAIPREIGVTPRAILMVSAHWEESDFTVQTSPHPPMLYDYGGFPEFTYHIQYPAPGAPDVAARAAQLLAAAGITVREDPRRGFDHGVFAPMYPMYPEADVPVLQLSLRRGLDPVIHLAAGRALAPLRDEGILIVGSGFPSFHDLSAFGPRSAVPSREFDTWLTDAVVGHVGAERSRLLEGWERAPSARRAHRREEHLLPMMVAVGAAEDEPGAVQYHEDASMGWLTTSGYRFGPSAAA
jgi:aromatic ring-opening dioxygenase catalytic subunit (LigB family)